MKRLRGLLLTLFIVLSGVLTGCSSDIETSTDGYRTVIDLEGNEIQVPEEITNYAVAWTGDFDILAMLDNCEHISAFPEQALKFPMVLEFYPQLEDCIHLPKMNISSESILESGAQIVFLRESDYPELYDQLQQQNIPVINVNFENYEELVAAVELVADVLNTPEAREKAKNYREYVESTMEEAKQLSSKVTDNDLSLLVFRDSVDYTAYSPDRMIGAWTNLCGMNYLVDTGDSTQNINLTIEQILEYDPEYIFFSFPGNKQGMIEDERMQSLKAVKNNHVYETPNVINAFPLNGSECILQLKWNFYVFWKNETNIDLEKEIHDFYQEFYNIDLTDEQMNEILSGVE